MITYSDYDRIDCRRGGYFIVWHDIAFIVVASSNPVRSVTADIIRKAAEHSLTRQTPGIHPDRPHEKLHGYQVKKEKTARTEKIAENAFPDKENGRFTASHSCPAQSFS